MPFAPSKMSISSDAFASFTAIPRKHTGEGDDISPPLSWEAPPEGTKAYVVVCHDPDAPLISGGGTYGFVHWVIYNIPSDVESLPEGVKSYTLGTNDMGKMQYNGPMPPVGHGRHCYYFWVIALDQETQLEPGLSMWRLLEKIEPYVIGMNRLVGTYQRE